MSVLVTGASGQLGTALVDLLGTECVGLTRADLDITDSAAVFAAVAEHRPEVVINAAAYTAVDDAESDEEAAGLINGGAVGNLATALALYGGQLIQVSTDYVFAGDATRPYETDDEAEPTTAYGRSKRGGEEIAQAVLPDRSWIVRTAWVYGGPGPNFVDTMRRLESERPTVSVVNDQIGSPTWVGDLAAALVELSRRPERPPGVLHYVNSGQASWYELARAVFEELGADPNRVEPVDTAAFPRPAPRPAWSVLSTRSWTEAGLTPPRPWREALTEALAEKWQQ